MTTDDRKDRSPDPDSVPTEPSMEWLPTQISSPEGPRLAPHTLIADRYRILETLGVGGMGIVYRARDEVLNLEVALKILRPDIAQDENFLRRFRNELVLARQVTHRHVVRTHDLGEHQGMQFMTMDLVEGRSLRDILKQEGKLELNQVVGIVRQVAEALGEAHRRNVVHRDLKPENILLDAAGDAYVTDFGVSRSLATPGLTQTGEVLGTPNYLSPEQARGEQVDGRSDLYTLGIIFIEMLSGKLPFAGGTLFEILARRGQGQLLSLAELEVRVPPAVVAVIEHCVAKEPDQRYQSAGELIEDLQDPRRPQRRRRRRVLWASALAAGTLLVIGLGGFSVHRWILPRLPPSPAVEEPAPEAEVVPEPGVPEQPLYSVAVLPFHREGGGPDFDWTSTGVAEILATSLAESGKLRVLESVRVFQTLQDLGFRPESLRPEEIELLADAFQVNRIVQGTLRLAGDGIWLEVRLVETDRPASPPRQVKSLRGEIGALFGLLEELGDALSQELEVPLITASPRRLTSSTTAMQAYSKGLEYLSRGETLKAAPALEQAVAADAEFTAAWVRLAKAYQSLGRQPEALEAARRAVESPGAEGGRVGFEAQAQEALLRGEPEEAQRILEQLVERYPNDVDAHIGVAEAYGQQGNFAEAISRLEKAVEIDPSDPRAWYLLGQYAIRAGDSRRAVNDYLARALILQNTLQNEQGQGQVLNALGVGYERLGLLDEATESYEKAAEIRRRIDDKRGLASTLHNLGLIYLARGDFAAAEEEIRAALEIHIALENQPGIAALYNAYGMLEEERGRYSEALDFHRRALRVRRELGDQWALAESYNSVGYSHYLLGEYDHALLHLEKSLELYQKNEDRSGEILTLQSIGFCQLAQGVWPKALDSFLEALNLSREIGHKLAIAVSRGNLGLVAQYQGRYAAAFSSYREAQEILTELGNLRGQAEFALHEAEALLELGDPEAAQGRLTQVEQWLTTADNREQRADLLRLRSRLHLLRGEVDAAEAVIAKALEEAEASHSAAALIRAQLGSGLAALEVGDGGRALDRLRSVAEKAERLGHAVLQLRVAEALATVELARGETDQAEGVLREAQRIAEKGGSWARAWRLHYLLAKVLNQRDAGDEAADALQKARDELSRIRENLDENLRPAFEKLPEVEELMAPRS